MQPDNIHAAGMVLLLIATFGIILVFPRQPLNEITSKRFIIAIPAGVFTFFALPSGMIMHFKSQASSNPASQSLLASLCLIIVILFVRKKLIVMVSCAVILTTGYQLNFRSRTFSLNSLKCMWFNGSLEPKVASLP